MSVRQTKPQTANRLFLISGTSWRILYYFLNPKSALVNLWILQIQANSLILTKFRSYVFYGFLSIDTQKISNFPFMYEYNG